MLTADLDITPRNVLLGLANIDEWSADDVTHQLGNPVKDEVFTFSGEKLGISAPKYLVEPASFLSVSPNYIAEEVLLIDLGEAFWISSPPPKGVGTLVSYCSPELILEGRASIWSDVWALSCTMFQMRSGFPLFESFSNSSYQILQEMVEILGTPPKALWPSLERNDIQIVENEMSRRSLSEQIRIIGKYDETPPMHGNEIPLSEQSASDSLIEPSGVKVSEDEVNSMTCLLQWTLDYEPERRLPADMIVRCEWLAGDF